MDTFSPKLNPTIDSTLASNSWVQATSPEAIQVLKNKYLAAQLVEANDSLRSKGGEHYRQGAIQPIDFIMSQNLDFPAGNVVKYVTRAGRKEGASAISDLRKAMHYLEFMLEKLEEEEQPHRNACGEVFSSEKQNDGS